MKKKMINTHDDNTKSIDVTVDKKDAMVYISLPNGARIHISQYAYMGDRHTKHYSVSIHEHNNSNVEITRFPENAKVQHLKRWKE